MTLEQKKAKEIVEKFYEYSSFDDRTQNADEAAKQCALIAVDEIIDNTLDLTLGSKNHRIYKYWQSVREEIEKL